MNSSSSCRRAPTPRTRGPSLAKQIDANNYDLKAVNPNRPSDTDTRTPAELLDEIEAHGRELADALADLRQALRLEEQPLRRSQGAEAGDDLGDGGG